MLVKAIDYYLKIRDVPRLDRSLLRAVRERRLSHTAFLESLDPQANRGFLRIERVVSARPVTLFGQNAPSYAFNRISVSLGKDGPDGRRVPGKTLMSALISEESLAQLMLSPNRSNNKIALTSETYLGEALPPICDSGRQSSSRLLEDAISSTSGRRLGAAAELMRMTTGLDKPISKARALDMRHLLERVLSDGDASFVLTRHAENLQKDLVQYRVEASSAALNIQEIAADLEQVRRLGCEEQLPDIPDLEVARNSNPLLDSAMDLYRPEEALACRDAMRCYMAASIQKNFPEGLDYDVMRDDPHAKILRNSLTWDMRGKVNITHLEKMAAMISSFGNEHVNEVRQKVDGYGLTASCSHISGGGLNLHSSFPTNDMGYFALRIHVGVLEESFGNEDIREGATFIELGLSPEDMMTALRGHPTGDDIPCSIDRLIGRGLPRVPHMTEIDRAIQHDGGAPGFLQARRSLQSLVSQASRIIESGAKKVADRRALEGLMPRIHEATEVLNAADAENIADRANDMNAQVRDMAREAISRIDEYVVEKHGISLTELQMEEERDVPAIGA